LAANPRAIARALPAANANPGGGYGHLPTPTSGGASPLVASYDQWTAGRTYGSGLPRHPAAFLTDIAFGPGQPIQPVGINAADPDSGRPEPRRFEYPVSWNLPHGVPGSEGLKLASFAQLRVIADAYSVVRSCIRVRIQEIIGIEWDLVPTKDAEKKMRGDHAARRDFDARRAEMMRFWKRPDPGKYHNFSSWFHAVLEDILVVDALSLYLQPTRRRGKGVLGSNLGALCHIAGDTVRPMLDALGGVPAPPNVAYQVYAYGVPRVDMMTALTGEDVADMGDALQVEYRGDQLLYLPYHTRSWSPYGFPPLEQALVPVLTGIQRQQYQLGYFSEGSTPGVFISAGDPNATPNNLRELQDALNAMAGDPAWKHKIIVLPQGSKIDPMRPIPLADQFDEIIMTQVCMAYDVMPMEMGIAPKVSTTQSPGASNQMAKASESVNQRKALRPLLKWLKASIFDYVVQDVCRQGDMQWMWEGLEEGQDEASKISLIVEQVEHGLMSVDEGRVELIRQPWGLPLTSDPVWATPTGLLPIGAIDPDTGQPAPAQPAIPGQPGAPADGSGTEPGDAAPPATPGKPAPGQAPTPAHAGAVAAKPDAKPTMDTPPAKPAASKPSIKVMAALRELDLIRRRIAKGRGLDRWYAEDLPDEIVKALFDDLYAGVDPDLAISKARASVKATAQRERRDTEVAPAAAAVTAGLRRLAAGLGAGTESTATFVDRATDVMRIGIRAGLKTGARHALTDLGRPARIVKADDDIEADDPDAYTSHLDGVADRRAAEQQPYLGGLLQDLLAAAGIGAVAGWLDSFNGRFDAYAGHVPSAYEEGYGLTTLASVDDPGTYTITWNTTSARPCGLCKARDGKTYTVESLPGWPGDRGYGADALCAGGPACRCTCTYENSGGIAVGRNTLRDTGIVAENRAFAEAQAQRLADVTAAREAFVASLPDGPRQRAQARDNARASVVAEQGGWPSDISAAEVARRVPATMKSASDLTDPNPVDAEHVINQMRRNYPEQALGWMRKARWVGPTLIPQDRIDYADIDKWAASHQKKRVKDFVQQIRAGEGHLHPVVAVQEPGNSKVKVIDGHHRTLAYRKLDRPMKAYVGFVDTDDGPWDETHLHQFRHGDDPANKAANKGPIAAGLVVHAADTGRVLMLQRAHTNDDPAAGFWEFPGGKLDPGETPLDAARREWAEETGCVVPDGDVAGTWTSPNGAYQGFVVVVAAEADVPIHDGRDQVTNPDDPDGDQIEALAWWDTGHLPDNPAVRPELLADIDTVLAALPPSDPA
jgi:8-oxo-dGTP pyrophosphatase MutT (NUDIX family)